MKIVLKNFLEMGRAFTTLLGFRFMSLSNFHRHAVPDIEDIIGISPSNVINQLSEMPTKKADVEFWSSTLFI